MEHAPYYHRDIHPPTELQTHRERGEFIVKVRVRDGYQTYVIDYHPFDVVGWDGYVYPWTFSIHDFEPITGRIHMPPPSHQTFEGPNFVICSFCPRKLDFDPEAIPIPYHHSNLQSEEMIYYVDGNFSSRKGIEVGSITLHPSGLPHGPQPGLAEKSLGMTETHEYAVMCDTFHPLRLTPLAADLDDGRYMYSWAEDPASTAGRPTRTPPASPRTSRVRLVLDWDGTCTVRDSLVAAVHDLGDPSVYEASGEVRHLRRRARGRDRNASRHGRRGGRVGGRARRAAAGLPRARRARTARDRLERPAAADPAGAQREGVELEVRSNGRPVTGRLARALPDEGPCPVCGDRCKRRSLPDERPLVFVGDGYSDRCASLACDRVFARDGLARYLPTGSSLRAVRHARRCRCCAFLTRTTSSSPRPVPASSGRTWRTAWSTVCSTEPSTAGRCGSPPRPAGSRSSRSTRRRARSSSTCSARRSTSTRSTPGRRATPCSRRSRTASAGSGRRCSRIRSRRSITSITAQQISSARRGLDPEPARRAVRDADRRGVGVPDARADRRRPRGRARRGRLHAAQGGVRRCSGAQRRSTSAAWPPSTTTPCASGSPPCAGSARGPPNGSSRATSRGRPRGPPATSPCARRPSISTVST